MDYGIAETGFARGSPPGTTTKVLRVGFPVAEIRFVSGGTRRRPLRELLLRRAPAGEKEWAAWGALRWSGE
jgi:hypothetical protein